MNELRNSLGSILAVEQIFSPDFSAQCCFMPAKSENLDSKMGLCHRDWDYKDYTLCIGEDYSHWEELLDFAELEVRTGTVLLYRLLKL